MFPTERKEGNGSRQTHRYYRLGSKIERGVKKYGTLVLTLDNFTSYLLTVEKRA